MDGGKNREGMKVELSSSVGDLARRLQMVVIRSQHPVSVDRISWDFARDLMEAASILLDLEKQAGNSERSTTEGV